MYRSLCDRWTQHMACHCRIPADGNFELWLIRPGAWRHRRPLHDYERSNNTTEARFLQPSYSQGHHRLEVGSGAWCTPSSCREFPPKWLQAIFQPGQVACIPNCSWVWRDGSKFQQASRSNICLALSADFNGLQLVHLAKLNLLPRTVAWRTSFEDPSPLSGCIISGFQEDSQEWECLPRLVRSFLAIWWRGLRVWNYPGNPSIWCKMAGLLPFPNECN